MAVDRAHVIETRTGLGVHTPAGRDSATATRCPDCRARVLVGLDDAVMALTAVVDPRALDRRDEVVALMAGRTTYRLGRDHLRRWQLRRRDHWQITGSPAGVVTVVAAHACGRPLGEPLDLDTRPAPPTEGVPF